MSVRHRPNTVGDEQLANLEQQAEKFLHKEQKKSAEKLIKELERCGAGTLATAAATTPCLAMAFPGGPQTVTTLACAKAGCVSATGGILNTNKCRSCLKETVITADEVLHPVPVTPEMRRGGKKTRNKRKRKRGRRTKRRRKKRKTRRKKKNLKKRTKSKK